MSEQYFTKRQNNLRALIAKEDLDGMLVTNLTHIRYLCGFTGSAGSLLITQDKCEFITDGRYTFQSKNEVKGAKTTITWGSHFDLIKKANLLPSNSNIAFDSNNVSHQIYAQLKDSLSHVSWHATSGCIESLAMIKDKKEIDAIKTAVEITDQAFSEVFPMIQIGVEEKEIANQLSFLYRKYGDADADAFSPIVGSGIHSAMPHQRPTDKKIGPGELVVIDSGAKYAGYHADTVSYTHLTLPTKRIV